MLSVVKTSEKEMTPGGKGADILTSGETMKYFDTFPVVKLV